MDETQKRAKPLASSGKVAFDIESLLELHGRDGNWNSSPYMCGVYNGLALALSCVNDEEPDFRAPPPEPAPTPTYADVQHAATEGRNTERDRILARLNAIKPGECSYTRIQSEWERKGAMRMWERMRDAIVDGKEAHKDRDALEGGE